MGNIQTYDFAPVRPEERKELNLSRKPTYKQFLKHLEGEVHEACHRELPKCLQDSIWLFEVMKIAFNALTELPPELSLRLPHLRHLDLSFNQLEYLPNSFGLLFHLQTLLVQHNRLQSLPETFIRLVKLERVDLSHNALRELPDAIGDMENLQRLNLAHNKLKLLPLSLGNSAKLCLLLCEGNRLDSPPQSVCDEGSAGTLQYLQKQYQAHQVLLPPRPRTPLNEFPRQRSNQLHSPVVANPHSAHMQYIQEQTHTTNTPSRIKTPLMPPLGSSSYDAFELRDKILGLIFGAALGDIVGLATRWLSPDQCAFYYRSDTLDFTEIVQDRHRMPWRQGDWTSNFDNLMLVIDSLISWAGVVDELDFAKRLLAWSERGFQELGDTAGIIISSTISRVVAEERFNEDPHSVAASVLTNHKSLENTTNLDNVNIKSSASSSQPLTKVAAASIIGPVKVEEASSCSLFGTDNGAVVRAAVLGIPNFHDLDEVEENTVRICKATHADPRCIASCVFVSLLVAALMQGSPDMTDPSPTFDWQTLIRAPKEKALAGLKCPKHKEQMEQCLQTSTFAQLKARERNEMSHTFKPVAAAVLALHWEGNFRDFIMKLSMEGGDSNSNCTVAGAIMGLRTGYQRLPQEWLLGLRTKQLTWLNLRVNHLLDMMGLP